MADEDDIRRLLVFHMRGELVGPARDLTVPIDLNRLKVEAFDCFHGNVLS
jgi:hypothetical protein